MSRRTIAWVSVLCLAIGFGAAFPFTAKGQTVDAASLFEYDATVPLNVDLQLVETAKGVARYKIEYDSAGAERVKGYLRVPEGGGKHPLCLFQHDAGANKDAEWIMGMADRLAERGYIVLTIDAQFFGERSVPGVAFGPMESTKFPYSFRNTFLQTAVDMRRGIDYLTSRDDATPDGFLSMGASYGSFLSVAVAAHDDRIKKLILIGSGGDLNKIMPGASKLEAFPHLKPVVDPVDHAPKILAPTLIVNGTNDLIVPKTTSKALYESLGGPKNLVYLKGQPHIPALDQLAPPIFAWLDGKAPDRQ